MASDAASKVAGPTNEAVWHDNSNFHFANPELALPAFISYRPNSEGSDRQTTFMDQRTGKTASDPYRFWEIRADPKGRKYYVDHHAKATSYMDPLKKAAYDEKIKTGKIQKGSEVDYEELTTDGNVFFVDAETGSAGHVYERPRLA
ncbi:hypothetical protein BT63DRAFT_420937 [Microthyrium microscopicum]|uniref:WW domain-containing protein n=1 Tax=Microthyrium microscopicum TaxID=703497 RepID=A0A6A6UKH7_9PEZI|nr:hypothetical protein BT63DRAFT_420937 [Microthyrium microscopicum]